MSGQQRNNGIAVIGAGIVGVQLARALQRAGFSVHLFDRDGAGLATSFGNAGFLATEEIVPLAHGRILKSLPAMLLDRLGPLSINWGQLGRLAPWFVRYLRACSGSSADRNIAALASLQTHARAAWEHVIRTEALDDLMRSNGAYKCFESARGFAETSHERELQSDYGIDWRVVPGPEFSETIPELGSRVLKAVHYPQGMHTVSPYELTARLFDRFLADGGTFHRQTVTAVNPDHAGQILLRSPAGQTAFAKVVICAGYQSGELLSPLRLRVPLSAERGYHVEMSHDEISFDLPLGFHERGFYITPMKTGLRLAGTTEFTSAAADPAPNWRRADILKRHVEVLLPGVARKETHRWMGRRPTLPDFLPAMGGAPGIENLYLSFGHQHLGLTLSAISARVMTELIGGAPPSIDLAPFDLRRFQ